ncbi:MAG TPA: GNAT family N-acetyltransferase [Candidatus Xenobia bacterium]
MNELTCRPAVDADLDELASTAWRAFRQGDMATWQRILAPSPWLQRGDTLVAERAGRMVGHATAMRFTVRLGAVDEPMRGVAAVTVVPEARRAGVADTLLRGLLHRMKEEGATWTFLYPFSISFYRKFGWGIADTFDLLTVRPGQFPASRERSFVRRLEPGDRPAVEALYEKERGNGNLYRTEAWWKTRVWERVSDGAVYDHHDGVRGYLLYRALPEAMILGRQVIEVQEYVAPDVPSLQGLLGFLHALGEQFSEIRLRVPPGSAVGWLTDIPPTETNQKVAAQRCLGTMGRILDVPAVVGRLSMWGAIGLDVSDPVFGDTCWDVDSQGCRPGRQHPERLALPIHLLSSVITGAVDVRDVYRVGLVKGSWMAVEALRLAGGGPAVVSPLNGY